MRRAPTNIPALFSWYALYLYQSTPHILLVQLFDYNNFYINYTVLFAFLLLDAAAAISGAAEDAAAITAAAVAAARSRHRPSGPRLPSSPSPVIVPHPSLFAAPVLVHRTRPRTPHPSSRRTHLRPARPCLRLSPFPNRPRQRPSSSSAIVR